LGTPAFAIARTIGLVRRRLLPELARDPACDLTDAAGHRQDRADDRPIGFPKTPGGAAIATFPELGGCQATSKIKSQRSANIDLRLKPNKIGHF
jgi:hypothetical protein